MKPQPYVIRTATPQDAEALSALCRKTFVETFGNLYTSDNLNKFLTDVYTPDLQLQEITDPQKFMRVVERDGVLIAYAKSGKCKLPVQDMPPHSFELYRLYVDAVAKGQGIGAALIRDALEYFKQQTADAVYLGVWSGNHAAHKFYAHYNFEKIDEYHFMVGEHADEEWIMQLKSIST